MKTIKELFQSIIILSTLYGYSQSPIQPKYHNPNYAELENAYYKDIDNVQNDYEGTWLYTEGNSSLLIKLRKREMVLINGALLSAYEDVLVGEYRYIEDGIEKVNTLSNFMTDYTIIEDYNLYDYSYRSKGTFPLCDECDEDEWRMVMKINEPDLSHVGGLNDEVVMRRFSESGVEKLKIWFEIREPGPVYDENTDELINDIDGYSLPYGEYVLIKQL